MRILCLSNGHGEDAIAVGILAQVQQQSPDVSLAALPLVGEGYAYHQLQIPIIGPVQNMPSGGFIYMDGQQFWRDMRGGLLRLTWAQLRAIKRWCQAPQNPEPTLILAVGDLVPLLMAWWSGANYAFVGTAKSEYYLRDETGWLTQAPRLERWLGAVYLPWERWLMGRSRCKAVFPRDRLTTTVLQQYNIPAFNLGNPMMDGLGLESLTQTVADIDAALEQARPLVIVLLPGSRSPEAERNWQVILSAITEIFATLPNRLIHCLGAIAPALDLEPFQQAVLARGWQLDASKPESDELEQSAASDQPMDVSTITEANPLSFSLGNQQLQVSQTNYVEYLAQADLAIAMAGTATEQFVGLGKPVITLPGEGPQFTPRFAEAQTRLLGSSLRLVEQPQQVATTLQTLLQDPDFWHLAAQNGKQRMGAPGAAARIAQHLLSLATHESY